MRRLIDSIIDYQFNCPNRCLDSLIFTQTPRSVVTVFFSVRQKNSTSRGLNSKYVVATNEVTDVEPSRRRIEEPDTTEDVRDGHDEERDVTPTVGLGTHGVPVP